MKHYLPIILYCGWFLMVPPNMGGKVVESLPIAQWEHWSSYDTASDCQGSKANQWDRAKEGSIGKESLFRARCIPADSIPVK